MSVDFSTLKSPPQGTGLLHLPLKALALAYRVRGFLFAGTLGFITDAGMTFQLMDLAQLSPFQALPLAMFCAIAVTFILNRRLTFANTSQGTTREFLRYLSVNILGASVNYTLYSLVLLTLTALAGDRRRVIAGKAEARADEVAPSAEHAEEAHAGETARSTPP